jgi:hypothetical protein
MLEQGRLRFGSLASYKDWEKPLLGDPREGTGELRLRGHPYTTESTNPAFAWCAALPEITPRRIRDLATDNDYDAVVEVCDSLQFIHRVHRALINQGLWLHCARVTYNKGTEVAGIAALNSQRFDHHLFQKDSSFSEDCEYRLALIDTRCKRVGAQEVFLNIGPCADILRLHPLEGPPTAA